MILISLCLLLTPGIIALRVCYRITKKQNITIGNSIADYMIVTFIGYLLVYLLLFLTGRDRTISFSPNDLDMMNNIYQAGFITKYCISSLFFSVMTGVAYSFCKMNPVVLLKQIKKELQLEKSMEEEKETRITM